jgi:hypothetical protein
MGDGATGAVGVAVRVGHRVQNSADGVARSDFAKARDLAGKSGTEPKAEHSGTDLKNLGSTAIGSGIIDRHPRGPTLVVPDNFDSAKVKAYDQRIKDPFDRGVGIRSVEPGTTSRTNDIRNRPVNKEMVENFAASQGGRPRGQQVDHTVELQHVIRPNRAAPGADTVRNTDHRFQDRSVNASQGASARQEDLRQIRAGAREDVPAGGVAKASEANNITKTQGYRTVAAGVGVYVTAGGTYAALQGVGEDIRNGNFGSAALGTSAYLGGASQLGAVANLALTGSQSTLLLNGARVLGAPAAVVGAGVVGVKIGTHLNEKYVNQEGAMKAGDWATEKFKSPVAGGIAAAGYAVGSAAYHAPKAAVDFVKNNMTLNPSEIDWDRTLKPWKWF